ncbi:MAG TPA: hypothetical protein VNT55_20015, partial [Baekduia sp.]|nr:hypothetical protein [Baekduia sp.]
LRHTALPARGRVPLKVEGGVRRTIVALPHDRCVSVYVHYHVRSFAARAATVLLGRSDTVFDDVVVFGHTGYGRRGTVSGGDPAGGPELTIDFTSAGGSLYVRDYPDAVDPTSEPDWPYAPGRPAAAAVHPGMSRTARGRAVAAWRARHKAYKSALRRVLEQRPGPCSARGGRS